MDFLAPNALWFLFALPVVVVFYLLKRKRVVKLIPSTLLWQKFLAENQANAPFQKLRKNWLLLIQLLLLLLIIFALTRPFFEAEEQQSRLRVLILDSSASMQATDVEPSRFEVARAEALKYVDGLRDNERMVVIQAGAATEVKQSKTSEKMALRRAINAYHPSDTITRLDEALRLAETLIETEADPEIHLFSDGAFPFPDGFENKPIPLVYHKVGESSDNVGITAMDVRANPENPSQRAIFANINNISTNDVTARLELSFNGSVVDARSAILPARESSPEVFIVDQTESGFFTLEVITDDVLKADNKVSVISLLPQPVTVLLSSAGNRFLERALRFTPNVELSLTSDLNLGGNEFDIVVVDNTAPIEWPDSNLLVFNSWQTNWFDTVGTIEGPPIVDWRNTHPLLRFVGLENVFVEKSLAVQTPPWALPLVESQQSPLVLAGEINRQRIVWVGFDSLESTWPLRVSFPIFIANAVDWLNPATSQAELLSVQAGTPFRFQFDAAFDSASIELPNGESSPLIVNTNSTEILFGETSAQGIYKLTAGNSEIAFTVNLMDPGETDIAPRAELPFGRAGRTLATEVKQANTELWRWIALAGLAMLMFEWWFYHKRTA